MYPDGASQSLTLDNGTTITNIGTYSSQYLVVKANSDGTLTCMHTYYTYLDGDVYGGSWTCKYITLNNIPFKYKKDVNAPSGLAYDISTQLSGISTETFTNTITPNVLDSIDKLQRTDPKNIKLIKLPYTPYDFTITGGIIDVQSDSNWDYIGLTQSDNSIIYLLKLNDMNTKLNSSIDNTSNNPIAYLYLTDLTTLNPSRTDTRRNLIDSKLFNSEFFQPTFYYDSFAFKVQLEKCDLDSYINNTSNFDIEFLMTKTINSKFMFTYKDYHLALGEENYAKVMPIARNNEEVLYNVPYINWIRTGYNYEVKAKNINNASNFIGLGLSVASVGVSLLAPSVPLKVAGVVASVVSVAMSVKNTIVSYVNNENSLKQKILQTQNQATSVAGSDDVDLMSEYAENRLKYIEYEPSPVMKSLLNDLFYYCGYASNRMGAPNHHTRVHFDYLQCNASFNNLGNMPEDVVQELINLFKTGITYIHTKELLPLLTDWDMDQTLENWELTLLGD